MSSAISSWHRVRRRLSPPFEQYLSAVIGDPDSLLDVGCGRASPIGRLRLRTFTLGLDIFPDALAESRTAGIHDDYRFGDALRLDEHFGPRSFDVVVALDLIEHFTDVQGLQLLEMMERVARYRVVVFTPNGFVPQREYGGNPWQVHRSGWTARRLRDLGYRVHGVNGIRPLRGEQARIRWRPVRAWSQIAEMSQPLAYRVPSLAFQILCVKDMGRHATAA